MITAILGAVTVVGGFFKGLFNLKGKKLETIQKGLTVLGDVQKTAAQRDAAIASIITTDSSSGGLASMFRPAILILFLGFVVSSFWGLTPAGLSEARLDQMWELVTVGLLGYMPLRGLEKTLNNYANNKTVRTLLEKKLTDMAK